MHVMDALVSHGVLLVDLTDGGTTFHAAEAVSKMWKAAEKFFELVQNEEVSSKLPGMIAVLETGSQHAKVGYASYDEGSTMFLETRRERKTGSLLPEETYDIIGSDGVTALHDAFELLAEVGKDVVRIATVASSIEHGAFMETSTNDRDQRIQASYAASLLANELVDDGKPLSAKFEVQHSEGSISMSPHRLCSYSDKGLDESVPAREVFGAHTDASFVTIVPVAAVSGLEVYDESVEKWYRPELRARSDFEEVEVSRGHDAVTPPAVSCDPGLPWYSRYVCVMPGEILQLTTRDEVPAAVHRVVASRVGPSRLSAPILLRPRPGVKFLAERYLGGTLGNPLLEECNGMMMEDIFKATQPSSNK